MPYGLEDDIFECNTLTSIKQHMTVEFLPHLIKKQFAGSGLFQKYTYYGHISKILAIGYRSFELYILDVKWYQSVMTGGQRPSIKVAQNGLDRKSVV